MLAQKYSTSCTLGRHLLGAAYAMSLPKRLWQTATPVIVGWFPGRTWEVTVYDTDNRLNYYVIFVV